MYVCMYVYVGGLRSTETPRLETPYTKKVSRLSRRSSNVLKPHRSQGFQDFLDPGLVSQNPLDLGSFGTLDLNLESPETPLDLEGFGTLDLGLESHETP